MPVPILLLFFLCPPSPGTDAPSQTSKRLPFSAARKAGPTLYVSGQVARKPDGTAIHGDATAETRQVMENIGRILAEHGYEYKDIVRATVYLRHIEDYAAMNAVYAQYFKGTFPARACVGGQDLVSKYTVEISCIAYKP